MVKDISHVPMTVLFLSFGDLDTAFLSTTGHIISEIHVSLNLCTTARTKTVTSDNFMCSVAQISTEVSM